MSNQLPPLPQPAMRDRDSAEPLYDIDQMHAYARAAQAMAYERVLAIVPANMPHDQPYRPVNLGWSQCAEFMRGMLSDFIYQAMEAE
ncbi:MAG: hypothetical protein IT530_17970 [Burkholderiales bacterium]|nr:hypothetical protein [Burkholderiales bacterium]